MKKKTPFQKFFSYAKILSDGSMAIDADHTKKQFINSIEYEHNLTCKEESIFIDYVKYGFPPDYVQNRDDFEGSCWYTGANGKCSKKIWRVRESDLKLI